MKLKLILLFISLLSCLATGQVEIEDTKARFEVMIHYEDLTPKDSVMQKYKDTTWFGDEVTHIELKERKIKNRDTLLVGDRIPYAGEICQVRDYNRPLGWAETMAYGYLTLSVNAQITDSYRELLSDGWTIKPEYMATWLSWMNDKIWIVNDNKQMFLDSATFFNAIEPMETKK